MKAFCPICRTEMVERANAHACPRNDIGDCTYDPLSHTQDNYTQDQYMAKLEQPQTPNAPQAYGVPDNK